MGEVPPISPWGVRGDRQSPTKHKKQTKLSKNKDEAKKLQYDYQARWITLGSGDRRHELKSCKILCCIVKWQMTKKHEFLTIPDKPCKT